jgi:hypothetical protein
MIAPLRPADDQRTETRRRVHRAKRLVGSLLVEKSRPEAAGPPRIAAWLAWLFALWVVVVVAVYVAHMAGLIR